MRTWIRRITGQNTVWLAVTLFVLISMAIIVAGYQSYSRQREVFRKSAQRELTSIAELKAWQVSRWRLERMGDAKAIQANEAIMRWLVGVLRGRTSEQQAVMRWTQSLTSAFDYLDVLLLYTNGNVCVSSRADDRIGKYAQSVLQKVLASDETFVSDFHRAEVVSQVHMDVLVPVRELADDAALVEGVLMLRIDPYRILYPMLHVWPGESATAETLLVRREAEDVVYLNEVRHQTNVALNMRESVHARDGVAGKAVRSGGQVVGGRDYRGQRVTAAACTVPGTAWTLIVKIDDEELYAPLRQQTWLLMLVVCALIISVGALIVVVWQRVMTRLRRERETAAREREALVQHFDYLTRYANDVILLMREDGKIIDANERALDVYGYTRDELLRMHLIELRTEAARATYDAHVREVISAGGAIYETAHRTKGGRVVPVEVSMRLIAVQQRRFFQAIIRDITERKQAQQSLAEAKRFLDNVFDSIQDGIMVLDRDLKVVRTNRAMERWFAPLMPLVGKSSREMFRTARTDHTWPAAVALRTGTAAHQLVRKVDAHGACAGWFDVYAFPMLDHDGAVQGVIEYVRDSTERMRAEAQLERTGKLYAVLNAVNQMIVRTRTRDQLLQAVCDIVVRDGGFAAAWIAVQDATTGVMQLAAVTGLLREALAHVVASSLATDAVAQAVCAQALREGKYFICHDIMHSQETRGCLDIVRQNGIAACAAFPLYRSTQVVGVCAFCVSDPQFFSVTETALLSELAADVSFALEAIEGEEQRRAAEAALRDAQERLLEAQRIAQVGDWSYDAACGIISMSEQAACNLGRAATACTCGLEEFLQCFRDEDTRRLKEGITQTLMTGERLECEAYINVGGAAEAVILVRGAAVRGATGGIAQVRGTLQDITSRVRAEQEHDQLRAALTQAQKMEAIGTLAGGVAHDFNNILTTITGYTDLALLTAREGQPLHEELVQVRNAAQRAAALTRQLLLFSRRQHFQRTMLDVGEVVRNILTMLQRIIGEHIELRTEIGPGLWCVAGDAGSIEQVVMNLVLNARDAMPHGGRVTISVRNEQVNAATAAAHPDATPGAYVALCVADTGTGITPEVRARMFEPFFTTKEVGKGTGLGLAVVYGIVRQHQGWIAVDSTPGVGTAFSIYLPAETQQSTPQAPLQEHSQQCRGSGERILVVEDDPAVRRFVCAALRNYGYTISEAGTGTEAREICARDGCVLLVSDVVLPDVNGVDLADQLRAAQPGLRVILCSGYTDLRAQWSQKTNPAYLFLQKPFQAPQLLELVRRALTSAPASG